MKKLLLLSTLILSSIKGFSQACPSVTTYQVLTKTDSSRIAYKFINPTNGNKTIRITVLSGSTSLLDTCVDASGQTGVERADTTVWFPTVIGSNIDFKGYTGNNCGGTYCWSNSVPLALKLTMFNAVVLENVVYLRWAVEDEYELNRYIVERSDDGITFNEVSVLQPGTHLYKEVIHSTVFYRLKLINQDGSQIYSYICTAYGNGVYTWPNPVKDKLYFSKETPYTIYSYQGKIVSEGTGKEVRLSNIPSGVYFLKVNGTMQPIIKQ